LEGLTSPVVNHHSWGQARYGQRQSEGAVRPHAAGVRSKIRIIILTGKTLCISRSTRMVNFRQKPHLGPGNVLVGAKALQIRVRTHIRDPGAQMGP
jgi:hypothetical protein